MGDAFENQEICAGTERHPFAPFIPPMSTYLFLGTFPPPRIRWSMDFYYPNWGNDMWRIMGLIFFEDKDYFCDKEEKRFWLPKIKQFLERERIAIYDTAEEVFRKKGNASDKFLEIRRSVDLEALLRKNPTIKTVVTTGEKAASVVATITNSEMPQVGESSKFLCHGCEISHYRMPSSSRAYPLSIEKKADYYKILFHK